MQICLNRPSFIQIRNWIQTDFDEFEIFIRNDFDYKYPQKSSVLEFDIDFRSSKFFFVKEKCRFFTIMHDSLFFPSLCDRIRRNDTCSRFMATIKKRLIRWERHLLPILPFLRLSIIPFNFFISYFVDYFRDYILFVIIFGKLSKLEDLIRDILDI